MLLSELIHAQDSCILIVTPEIRELQDIESNLRKLRGEDILSLGTELSAYLTGVPQRQWERETRNLMTMKCRETSSDLLICSQIDILFEPELLLDPLALFQSWSRIKRLLVLWPGTIQDGKLSYAVPEHAHFRTWQQLDTSILDWQTQHIYHKFSHLT
jgi:hypothetical protein